MDNYTKEWEIIFLIPNIGLREPFWNDRIAVAAYDDPRVVEIVASSKWARYLVTNFEDQFRRRLQPAVLLLRKDVSAKLREIDAIVAFRNIFAISSIIKGHEHSLKARFVAYPLYSDYFDFYPISISRKNDGFITRSPAIRGFDDEGRKFRGQTSPGLANPGHINADPDRQLFSLLEKAWKRRFVSGRRSEWQTTTLFRSLEMAYQATTMPFKNYSTIYDFGSSASLWVSAFEILSHPKTGKTDLRTVLNLLGEYKWRDRKLKSRAYKLEHRGQKIRVNLVQKLYKEMYDARNDFLHGNPVKPSRLYPFKNSKGHPITRFAPLLYKVGLLCFLKQFNPKSSRRAWKKDYISKWINERGLSEAILKSRSI
jgi:hypothetical protein